MDQSNVGKTLPKDKDSYTTNLYYSVYVCFIQTFVMITSNFFF